MYVIIGATGNVGSALAQKLLAKGKPVRAIARDASRLKALADQGAEVLVGSLLDTDFLYQAFQRTTAVFALIPEDPRSDNLARQADTIGGSITTALRLTRVPFILNLSSIGGDVPGGTGPITGLHRQEERLNLLEDSNVLHLRPSYFMENFLRMIPLIKQMGIIGSSIRADLPMGIIATRDIADYAAQRLNALDFKKKSAVDLMGPEDLTLTQAAHILGGAIGKPDLRYVHFSSQDAENGMIQMGISPDVARNVNEMNHALNEGLIQPIPRTPQNTTSTTLTEFARTVFAGAYNQ